MDFNDETTNDLNSMQLMQLDALYTDDVCVTRKFIQYLNNQFEDELAIIAAYIEGKILIFTASMLLNGDSIVL